MIPVVVPLVQPAPALDPAAPATAWASAAAMALPWDSAHARPADEATSVAVATDGRFLYVRFRAAQREPVTATQHFLRRRRKGDVGD